MASIEQTTRMIERIAKSLEDRTVTFTQDQLVRLDKTPCLNLSDLTEEAAYTYPDSEDYLMIECSPSYFMTTCPCCKQSGFVVRNGYTSNRRLVHDIRIGLTQVDLSISVPKYRCKNCGATPNHEFESIEHNRQFTKRLYKQIKIEAFNGNFEEVARKYGLSPSNVAFVFDAYAEELESKRGEVSVGHWLAIDEKHIAHKMRGVLIDGESGRLLEMTEDTKAETIKRAITSLKNYENVRFVTTDMAGGYKSVIEQIYGSQVSLVVDKWHVLNDLYKKIAKCRTAIIEYLNTVVPREPESPVKAHRMAVKKMAAEDGYLFKYGNEKLEKKPTRLQLITEVCLTFPEYNHLRLLKEGFERIYSCQTRAEATATFEEWMLLVPPSGATQRHNWELKYRVPASLFDEMKSLKKTVSETWNKEIFNYFDTGVVQPLTNAIAESTNAFIARFSKDGYSFSRLRAKALYWHLVDARSKYVLETRTKIVQKKQKSMSEHTVGYSIGRFTLADIWDDGSNTSTVKVYGIYEVEGETKRRPLSVLYYLSEEKKKAWNDYVLGMRD